MLKAKNFFWILFWLNSIVHLWATFTENQQFIQITKPLLMPLLAISLFVDSGFQFLRSRNLVLLGLLFSCVGDVLLMLNNAQNNFFVFGLISFLLAHIAYIAAFWSITSLRKGHIAQQRWLVLIFLLYLLCFNFYLYKGVPADLKAPVIIYSLVIMTMAISALNLNKNIINQAFYWIFLGALFFLVSDSVLAAEKFRKLASSQGFNASVIIMLTYILGQFGIAKGVSIATKSD
ncbi:MAG: lysoplasmalogenase [Saprospiraceae bacterium]|nr:lysoplasmalogenase [Saprospiraceae bacterium]